MFSKLDQINFETLGGLSFSKEKSKKDFNDYFLIAKKIYDLYFLIKEFEGILSENDKKVLKTDIEIFSNILINIQNKEYKIPDERLKKEKFSDNYINWLTQIKDRYIHFSNLLKNRDGKISDEKQNHENAKNELLGNIKNLEETKKNELEEKSTEINKVNSEKGFLEDEKKKLELELQKKELNKLAEAFDIEEKKYNSGNTRGINLGFFLLSIPSLFSIYIVLSEFIDNKFFNVLKITDFTIYEIIPFIVLTLILWYFQYFQLKNYYINRDLATNFSNRKAIANSFKGLLELVNEEGSSLGEYKTELTTKFIDKVGDIIYSNIDTSYMKKHNEDVPVSKFLDTVNELIKKVK